MCSRREVLASLMLFSVALAAVCGCFEIADLVKSIAADAEPSVTPSALPSPGDGNTSTPDDDLAYGPFPPTATPEPTPTPSATPTPSPTPTPTPTPDTEDPTLEPLPDDAVVETLESGLQVYDFEVGDGDQPESRNDSVRVDYAGYILETGRRFDTGTNIRFILTNVIDGFAEGILGMKVGGRRRIFIPPDLGYGEAGNAGAGISGDDVIVFDVTLLGIE